MITPDLDSFQAAFVEQVGPYLSARPGGIGPLATQLGVQQQQLKHFLKGKTRWEKEPFEMLEKASGALYSLDEWEDGHWCHSYMLPGNSTLYAPNLTTLLKAEGCVSGSGDCDGVYDLVCLDIFYDGRRRDFLVIDRGAIFVILIDKPGVLDRAVVEHRLSRFDGTRVVCVELFEMLNDHFDRILDYPFFNDKLDEEFFVTTELAFRQMTVAPPWDESAGSCYKVGDPMPIT